MPSTTTLGYPIPLDSDPVADLALAVRDLAQAVDDNVGKVYAGTTGIDLVAASTGTVVVNFPVGRFSGTPVVTGTATNQNYYVTVSAISSASVTVRVSHRDGSNATATVNVHLIAVQQ